MRQLLFKKLEIKSITWTWGHTVALHLILCLIRGLLTTSLWQKNYKMIAMYHLFPINFKFYSPPVTKLSYITWSCIKEALTIFLRRPSTFHLEGKFRKKGNLKFPTLHHQVQYGWRWIRINPLNPTAHIWPLMVSMVNEFSAKPPATLAISDSVYLYHLIEVQNSTLYTKNLNPD